MHNLPEELLLPEFRITNTHNEKPTINRLPKQYDTCTCNIGDDWNPNEMVKVYFDRIPGGLLKIKKDIEFIYGSNPKYDTAGVMHINKDNVIFVDKLVNDGIEECTIRIIGIHGYNKKYLEIPLYIISESPDEGVICNISKEDFDLLKLIIGDNSEKLSAPSIVYAKFYRNISLLSDSDYVHIKYTREDEDNILSLGIIKADEDDYVSEHIISTIVWHGEVIPIKYSLVHDEDEPKTEEKDANYADMFIRVDNIEKVTTLIDQFIYTSSKYYSDDYVEYTMPILLYPYLITNFKAMMRGQGYILDFKPIIKGDDDEISKILSKMVSDNK